LAFGGTGRSSTKGSSVLTNHGSNPNHFEPKTFVIYRIEVILNRNPALTGKLGEIAVVSPETSSDNSGDFTPDILYDLGFSA